MGEKGNQVAEAAFQRGPAGAVGRAIGDTRKAVGTAIGEQPTIAEHFVDSGAQHDDAEGGIGQLGAHLRDRDDGDDGGDARDPG